MSNVDHVNGTSFRSKVVYELIFTLIPIICLVIVSMFNRKINEILFSYEWSLIACILFGQLIAKFVSMSSSVKPPAHTVTLFVTIIICLGLIPSTIILGLSLLNDGVNN